MLIRRILPVAAALLAALPDLTAQNTTVFPPEYASAAGGGYETYLPFAYGVSRVQYVIERQALGIPDGRQINQLQFRQLPGYTSAGHMVQMSIYMGGTDKTAADAGSDFLANYSNGTARSQVFGPAVFTAPTLSATSPPWSVATIPLTTPYTYHANENLVVEFAVTANNNANQPFVYYLDAGYFHSPVTNFGQGCLTSANQIPALNGTGGYLGSYIGFSLNQAPANSTLYFHMNIVPSTPLAGDPFGAPGCTLLVNPLVALLSTAPGGNFNYSLAIPNHPIFYDLHVYGQAIIFDLFANPLGFAASNGTLVRVGRLSPMTEIYAQGSASAATGYVYPNAGPIFVFGHN